jgi:hypothetical protein
MKKILEYLVALFTILSTSSMFFVATEKHYYLNGLLAISLIILIFYNLLNKKYKKIRITNSFIFLFLYFIFAIIFMLINVKLNIVNFVYVFLIIFPLFYFYYCIISDDEKNNIFLAIVDVMVLLSVLSLFFYIFGSLLKIISPTGIFTVNWGKISSFPSFYNLHFNTQGLTFFGHYIIRNTGVFPEAPMYSLNLVIAYAICKLLMKDCKKYKKIILSLAIFTTLSTTGIILWSVIFLYCLIKNNRNKKSLIKLIFPFILLSVSALCIFFFTEKTQTLSFSTRLDDYVACFKAWKENILFGNGYNNETIIKSYMSSYRTYNMGLSNSLFALLAQCGLYGLSFYFFAFLRALKLCKTDKNKLFFCLIIFILFITTLFQYRSMAVCLLAMGYSLRKNSTKENG